MNAVYQLKTSPPTSPSLRSKMIQWSSRSVATFILCVVGACTVMYYNLLPSSRATTSSRSVVLDNRIAGIDGDDEHAFSGGVAWLMSFPNSGTTYTNLLVHQVSGYNTATNYGNEEGEGRLSDSGTNVAVYEDSPVGPFFSGQRNATNYKRPERGYVLSKTHCGSYCLWCYKSDYLTSASVFAKQCRRSSHAVVVDGGGGDGSDNDNGGNSKKLVEGYYNTSLVKRAVHLMRDPFSNIVARFHHFRKKLKKENKLLELEIYPSTRIGFRKMCSVLDAKLQKDTVKSDQFYRDVRDLVKSIPCISDFYRYVQWHNHAFLTTSDLGLDIPSLILPYENYTTQYNLTVDTLLDFLRLEKDNDPPIFITGKTYREYFDEEEIDAVAKLFRSLALPVTWEHTRHYFEE